MDPLARVVQEPHAGGGPVTYALNPLARMSTGRALAQTAHGAVMAADDDACAAPAARPA